MVLAVSYEQSDGGTDINLYKFVDDESVLFRESALPVRPDALGFVNMVYDKTSFRNGRIINANYERDG